MRSAKDSPEPASGPLPDCWGLCWRAPVHGRLALAVAWLAWQARRVLSPLPHPRADYYTLSTNVLAWAVVLHFLELSDRMGEMELTRTFREWARGEGKGPAKARRPRKK